MDIHVSAYGTCWVIVFIVIILYTYYLDLPLVRVILTECFINVQNLCPDRRQGDRLPPELPTIASDEACEPALPA